MKGVDWSAILPDEDIVLPTEPTISSLQIAEITGKPHNDVLKDIRRILTEAEIGLGQFSQSYLNSQNKPQPCYLLPRLECDLVMSGYSVKYRHAIIVRWHELEAKRPETKIEWIRQALEAEKRLLEKDAAIEEKDAALALAAPKIEFYDTVMECDSVCHVGLWSIQSESGFDGLSGPPASYCSM